MNIYLMKKPKRVNTFSVTLFFVIVIGGYFSWWFIPQWFPIFNITGMMRGTCNDMYRVFDDEKLIKDFLKSSRRTGLTITRENIEMIRVIPAEEDMIQMPEKQKEGIRRRGIKCIFRFHYEEDHPWPLIGKTTHMTWDREVESNLELIKWEKKQWGLCTCVSATAKGSP